MFVFLSLQLGKNVKKTGRQLKSCKIGTLFSDGMFELTCDFEKVVFKAVTFILDF